MDDRDWLAEYVKSGSNEAFARIVGTHVDLVYSVARRGLGDSHSADDVTQAVFLILAQKARKLPPRVLLSSWLFRTTTYVCRNARRMAARRNAHERKAAAMHSEIQEPALPPMWERMSPMLNEAVESLKRDDRDAILLRYFEKKEVAEVSAKLGISEAAARKRISRAVEKLGDFFRSRGVDAPVSAIDAGLIAGAVTAAPHALRDAAVGILGTSSTSSSAAATLAKGALIMTAKAKVAAIAAVALLLIGSTTAIVMTAHNDAPLASTAAPTENLIRIGAFVDGRSQLRIRGNTAQWHHMEYVVPGKLSGENRPTVIDGQRWIPKWPTELATPNFTDSDTFDRVKTPLPRAAVEATVQQMKGVGAVTIVQQPTEDNDYTLIVEFDDRDHPGASDYLAEVRFPSTPTPGVASSQWRQTTPGGVTAEVIGVSALPDPYMPGRDRSWAEIAMDKLTGRPPTLTTRPSNMTTKWWKPDGSPLAKMPYSGNVSVFLNSPNVYRFVLNVDAPKHTNVTFRITNSGRSWGTSAEQRGPRKTYIIYAQLPENTTTFGIRMGAAGGAWSTIAENPKVDTETTVTAKSSAARSAQLTFAPVQHDEKTGKAMVILTIRRIIEGDQRLIARLTDGREVPAEHQNSSSDMTQTTIKYAIPLKASDTIDKLEFQTRKYDQWLDFKDIVVKPAEEAAVAAN